MMLSNRLKISIPPSEVPEESDHIEAHSDHIPPEHIPLYMPLVVHTTTTYSGGISHAVSMFTDSCQLSLSDYSSTFYSNNNSLQHRFHDDIALDMETYLFIYTIKHTISLINPNPSPGNGTNRLGGVHTGHDKQITEL